MTRDPSRFAGISRKCQTYAAEAVGGTIAAGTSVTFTLPPNSGPFPLEPGSATITVTVAGQTSSAQTITVTS